jgi:hypothetical protein
MTPQLKKVLDDIKHHSIFINNDFRLAGGTALAYHINHRLSEDLDFFINGKLPKDDIDKFDSPLYTLIANSPKFSVLANKIFAKLKQSYKFR